MDKNNLSVNATSSNFAFPIYDEALLYRLELASTGANVHLVNNLRHAYACSFRLLMIQLNRGDLQAAHTTRIMHEETTRRIVQLLSTPRTFPPLWA